jgi:hypothetical protein
VRSRASEDDLNPPETPARGDAPLRIVVGLGLAASLVLNFGIIDLVTAIAPGPEWEPLRMWEAGWGVLFGVVLPIALAAQLARGGSSSAATGTRRWAATARARAWSAGTILRLQG